MPLWLKTLLKAVFITFIICCAFVAVFSFIYSYTLVEGGSMYPTLNNFAYADDGTPLKNGAKDSVYINRFTGYKKEDLVVFYNPSPDSQNKYVVKRLIATGGDKIAITLQGIYLIESGSDKIQQLEENYLPEGTSLHYTNIDFENYRKKNPTEFKVINDDKYGSLYFLTLQSDEVFLLGDNRRLDKSNDSADYGVVDASKYIGRVDIIAYQSQNNFSHIFLYFWHKLFG